MTLQTLSVAIAGACASTLALAFLWSPQNVLTPFVPSAEANQRPPAPPRTPPPNSTRPGGGLNPGDGSCRALSDGLRALIPVDNPVLTTTAYPTFLFYVPVGAEAVEYGEFSLLLWPDETVRHYQIRFNLPESPGIVSVTLPEVPTYALAEDQTYRWYFQLLPRAEGNLQPFILSGAVQRVALTSERDQQIQAGSAEIWYDALASVADRLQQSPQDSQLQTQWQGLLQHIEAEDVGAAQFVGPVLPLEE